MKIWMKGDGSIIFPRITNKAIDLRNTSPERPVVVPDEVGRSILLKGRIMEVKGEGIPPTEKEECEEIVQPEEKAGKKIVQEEVEEDADPIEEWKDMKWHAKRKFAMENGYRGASYKGDMLDNWFEKFIKDNEL